MTARGSDLCIALLLGVLAFALFGPSISYDFVGFDDDKYIVLNDGLHRPFGLETVRWALLPQDTAWMPLTWLSYAFDHAVSGLDPRGYHRTNVLLHALNCFILYFALLRLTSARWRSALVVALFAVHPLRVESVAWVADRKDLLAGTFFGLTLWSYARLQRGTDRTRGMALVVFFHTCGILAKTSLVTTPALLLLLDYWPLRRLQTSDGRLDLPALGRALREKGLLVALSSIGGAIAFLAVRATLVQGELVEKAGFGEATLGALASYWGYLDKTFLPTGLAVFYPPLESDALVGAALAFGLVGGAVTLGVFALRRGQPHLAVGWLWFLGTLLPLVGFLEIGAGEAMADRYSYTPQIGLFVGLVWCLGGAWLERRSARGIVATLAVGLVATLAMLSRSQLPVWRNGTELLSHTLEVAGPSAIVHHALGHEFRKADQLDEAARQFQKAQHMDPTWNGPLIALGDVRLLEERVEEAILFYRHSLEINPGDVTARIGLAQAFLAQGRPEDAISELGLVIEASPAVGVSMIHTLLGVSEARAGNLEAAVVAHAKAVELDPSSHSARANLGLSLVALGRDEEAVAELLPLAQGTGRDDPTVRLGLAQSLFRTGREGDAIGHARAARRLRPAWARPTAELARMLATAGPEYRAPAEALALARRAVRGTGRRDYRALAALSAALAANGEADRARTLRERAVTLGRQAGDDVFVAEIEGGPSPR